VLHFTAKDGLASDYTHFVLPDRENNIWVATENGLSRIQPAVFRVHDRREGLKSEKVTSVSPASDGGLWVATDAGLQSLSDDRFSAIDAGAQPPLTIAVMVNSKGTVLVATHGGGLYHLESQQFIRDKASLLAEDVSALFEDSERRLWVGQRSLNIVPMQDTNGNWNALTLPNPEPVADVRCFAEDDAGGIWVGTDGNGLFHWNGANWARFSRTNGLPSDSIWTLHFESEDHSLWIGTAGSGLARWKENSFSVCDMSHGLWDNTICQMFDDGEGWFWFGSLNGVFRVSKASLRQFMNGEITRIHSTTYGLSDGLTTLACSGGFQPSGCRTVDGKLWFSTMRGLACVDPSTVRTNPYPPVVRLERVLLDGKEIRSVPQWTSSNSTAPAFLIPPGSHRCEFQFTGLSFTAPEEVEFKYRLEGLEPDWVDAGISRSATYSHLPPGEYGFMVEAANRDGIWSQAEEAIRFRALPTFWQTAGFRFLCFVIGTFSLVATGWLIARNRARHRLLEITQAHALERERTRIAKDIHDNLGSGLTHISWLSDLAIADSNQPEQVRVHTHKIAKEAKQMVQSLDETVWAVSPENDTLESLVEYVTGYAKECLQSMDINCHIEAPDDLRRVPLSADARHDLYLAVKEALNNLVKHADARNARITIGIESGWLAVSVEDDGRGFDPAKINGRGGHGLTNLRSRLDRHRGEFVCDTALGHGTRLVFRLPIRGPL